MATLRGGVVPSADGEVRLTFLGECACTNRPVLFHFERCVGQRVVAAG
ncbi:MAG: hypothetical protein ACREPW_04335 [Candidatus Binataceae bacterium]